ncbi:MAG: DUF835 domain-containing protein [Thermoplasmata archaeon]
MTLFSRKPKGAKQELSKPEELLQITRKYSLRKGRGYIVEDPQSVFSFDILANLLSTADNGDRLRGFVVSRQHPNLLREKFGLENTPMIWLATQAGENIMDPSSLGLLAHAVMDFLAKTKNGVVLIDGVEYLVTNNDFKKVIRMLEQINDFVMHYQGYLIVPIDPRAFDEKELAILQRNFELITQQKGPD